MNEVAPRVYRLGTSLVNWYVVEDEDGLTVVDAGLPNQRSQLDTLLSDLGRSLSDVRALILTHAHADHIGIAEGLRTEGEMPVLAHAAEEELARTGKQPGNERSLLPYLRHPAAWRMIWAFGRSGGARPPRIGHVANFEAGEVLEVPGRPRVIHTPGHTPGHCLFHIEDRGVVFVGDAICELNPLTGARGPQILPSALNQSSSQALESLDRLAELDATILFGHGEPWSDGTAEAVAEARDRGPS